ncbi:PA domain-containing protein [Haloechinothrix halophila]|uniref:PA domain-containing protein n=1 Tax=Haloechinothrix halophila TaxID=1069073 RepID=UPI0003F8FD18|nr:PA domain-containing protein [Haloechinothrix halophila]
MKATSAKRWWLPPVAALVVALPLAIPASAHDDSIQGDGGALYGAADVYTRHQLSGHQTAEPGESGPDARAVGFDHVSSYTFDEDGDGEVDTGIGSITDVWEHDGYAYVGTFYEPDCSRFGTRIVDINDPANPAYVGNLESMPNTRVNDVKVTSMDSPHFSGDILAATQEPCFETRGDGGSKENKGGVVLYDVSDPAKPELLKKAYIKGRSGTDGNFGVHNTYFWESDGRTYLGIVDDDNVRDFHILDVTKPANPVEVAAVGWPDWLDATTDPQGANGLGSFASTFLHDIWVEEHDGKTIGYLSYWDAGLILLDLSDPANPVFLGDSDYDTTGPEGDATGEEGNSHVAVPAPAEDGRYVLMGDEDFSPHRSVATYDPAAGDPVEVNAAEGAFTTPLAELDPNPLPEEMVSAGGELCSQNGIDMTGKVALISRGSCTFQLKAENAKAQGAIGMVVYNDAARGDSLVLMGGSGIDDFFGFFVGNSDGVAMENAVAAGATTFNVQNLFDGWGYLRSIDTRTGEDKFAEVDSFAPPSTFQDPPLPGDYTMHNIVMGPQGTEFADTAFISWYSDGMIALDASDPSNLDWTGQWIGCYGQSDCQPTLDSNGNAQAAATNFWGVYPTVIDGEVYVLGSDRNNGLVVLKPSLGGDAGEGLRPGNGGTP